MWAQSVSTWRKERSSGERRSGTVFHGPRPLFTRHVRPAKTGEPAIESLLTSAVVEAFSTNGRLRVVKREDADAILEGEVIGYSVLSISYDSQANVRQYRLIMTINLKLLDMRRSAVLFEERNLREKADFQVMNAVSQTISVEETAVRTAATEIARAIVSLTVTRF